MGASPAYAAVHAEFPYRLGSHHPQVSRHRTVLESTIIPLLRKTHASRSRSWTHSSASNAGCSAPCSTDLHIWQHAGTTVTITLACVLLCCCGPV
jgi:hypothetical protein